MSYDVVRYHAGLRPGVVALMRHLIAGDAEVCSAYFRWKHEENPFVAAPVAYVALHEGIVVGLRSFMGARWEAGGEGEPQTMLCACDLVVDPAHRGKGLHRRIMGVALEGLRTEGRSTVLSLSASPITYHASLRMGWTLVAPYASHCIETGAMRHAERAVSWIGGLPWVWRYKDSPLRTVLNRGFAALDARWERRAGGVSVVFAREPRLDAMEALARKAESTGTRQVRDASYYRWRFRNPVCEYRFFYRGERSPTAFVVLGRSRRSPHADLSLVDYAALSSEDLAAMIGEIVAVGGYDRLSLWTNSLPAGVPERLRAMGFGHRDLSRGDPAYRPGLLALDLAATGDATRPYDLRMLDSDAY